MTPSKSPASVTLGVDVGGTKVLGVALDASGTVLGEQRVATPRLDVARREGLTDQDEGRIVVGAVIEVVEALRRATGAAGEAAPIGVGIPGMVDRHGVLRMAPNLPGVFRVDVPALVAEALPGTSVVADNDANLAGLAEHALGAARGADAALVVTLGTGIGGALVIDGEVERGANGFAGEVGHMLVQPGGERCSCGRQGCWERYASGEALGRLARRAARAGRLGAVVATAGRSHEDLRGEDVTAAAFAGDVDALAVLDELGWWIAVGLANLVAVLDPSCVVLGGGIAEAGDLLVAPVRRSFADLLYGRSHRPAVEIVCATMGGGAGAVGAALLARGAR